MHVVAVKNMSCRRMYLPQERLQVTDEDGNLGFSFNIGKMFKRLTKVTKTSFRPKNIFGAIGSGAANFVTFGAASAIAPKVFSAHSKTMRQVGMGVSAAALAAGTVVTAGALAPALGGMLTGVGGSLLSAGGTLLKFAPSMLSMFTKKSSGGVTQYQYTDPNTGLVTSLPPGITPQQAIQLGLMQTAFSGGQPGELTVYNESLPGYGKSNTIIAGIPNMVTIGGGLALVTVGIIYLSKRRK
jgi:hypothetical protein